MQETKVLEFLHYNPVMSSTLITEEQKKGWRLHSIFCIDTNYKCDRKQLLKTLHETAQRGYFKDELDTALTLGVRPKGCVFTVFLIRDA